MTHVYFVTYHGPNFVGNAEAVVKDGPIKKIDQIRQMEAEFTSKHGIQRVVITSYILLRIE